MKFNGRKISVLGKIITIEEKDLSEFGAYHGLYVDKDSKILLNKNDTPEQKLETLIHEIGHAISRRGSLNQAITSELEEIICDQWAVVLSEIFDMSLKKKK